MNKCDWYVHISTSEHASQQTAGLGEIFRWYFNHWMENLNSFQHFFILSSLCKRSSHDCRGQVCRALAHMLKICEKYVSSDCGTVLFCFFNLRGSFTTILTCSGSWFGATPVFQGLFVLFIRWSSALVLKPVTGSFLRLPCISLPTLSSFPVPAAEDHPHTMITPALSGSLCGFFVVSLTNALFIWVRVRGNKWIYIEIMWHFTLQVDSLAT